MKRFRNLPGYYKLSLLLFIIAIVLGIASSIVGAQQFVDDFEKAKAPEVVAPDRDIDVTTKSETKPTVIPETGSTNYDPATPDPAVVEQNSQAVDKYQQMERIPFTAKPVTPGNPESYQGTYGQCPFYENAGEKGCFPPPDLTCNADWSYCESTTKNTNQEDAYATEGSLRSTEPSPAPATN